MENGSSLPVILAVDLDGTLVRSDMLYETFWSAFARNWTIPFVAVGLLRAGRAALTRRLTELSRIDVAALPYNEDVLAYVRRWRARGGRAALLTASHQALADRIAAHIGEFDQVFGASESTNLKGAGRAAFLAETFGEGRFAYIGDSAADLPVWGRASKAVTVHASAALRARVNAVSDDAEHLPAPRVYPATYLEALRPHQWLKNLLVFVPMLVAYQFTVEALVQSLLAFISFCLIASSAYVLNDLLDLSADRAHPRKRHRPLASGALPIAQGTMLAPLLFIAGIAIAFAVGGMFAATMLAYFATTMAYSLHLKRRLIIDVCILAGLYAMRVLAGGVATGIELSVWLLAFSIFFFYALASIKRQAELVDPLASGGSAVRGRGYRASDVSLMASMAAAAGYVSVLVMALYVNSPDVLTLYSQPQALWGICLVLLYWISRMVMVTHRGRMHDDPIVYATRDRISQICLLLILLFIAGAHLL
jgi:4-hydroxybenzoate polyprenyltransferase/phosphoserine phosphatase